MIKSPQNKKTHNTKAHRHGREKADCNKIQHADKMALKTQKEIRKLSIVNQRHKIYPFNNIPLKCLSINNENKLLHMV